MGVRELKEEALELYARRRFAECARTYGRLLELEPRDPHLHMRHAEACRRAGDRERALRSYLTASELLQQLGCEARARAAVKVALELDPRSTEAVKALEKLCRASERPAERVEPPPRPALPGARLALPAAPSSPVEAQPFPAEVRRLSAHTLAVRAAPGTRWLVVSSRTPLTAYEVDALERVVQREFTLEITVAPES